MGAFRGCLTTRRTGTVRHGSRSGARPRAGKQYHGEGTNGIDSLGYNHLLSREGFPCHGESPIRRLHSEAQALPIRLDGRPDRQDERVNHGRMASIAPMSSRVPLPGPPRLPTYISNQSNSGSSPLHCKRRDTSSHGLRSLRLPLRVAASCPFWLFGRLGQVADVGPLTHTHTLSPFPSTIIWPGLHQKSLIHGHRCYLLLGAEYDGRAATANPEETTRASRMPCGRSFVGRPHFPPTGTKITWLDHSGFPAATIRHPVPWTRKTKQTRWYKFAMSNPPH